VLLSVLSVLAVKFLALEFLKKSNHREETNTTVAYASGSERCVSIFRVFPCPSVANASAYSWFYFRGKCNCFLAQPSLTHPALNAVFCFREIPCPSVANASAWFSVFSSFCGKCLFLIPSLLLSAQKEIYSSRWVYPANRRLYFFSASGFNQCDHLFLPSAFVITQC